MGRWFLGAVWCSFLPYYKGTSSSQEVIMTNQQQYEIVAGPSREELFDALRLRHEGRKVSFTMTPRPQRLGSRIEMEKTFNVFVNGIKVNDIRGKNWLLDLCNPNGNLGSQYLRGYFNTMRRKGWVCQTSS